MIDVDDDVNGRGKDSNFVSLRSFPLCPIRRASLGDPKEGWPDQASPPAPSPGVGFGCVGC